MKHCVLPFAAAFVVLAGCVDEESPKGLRPTPPGDGPRVVFDLFARPLPVIPLPNDVATWPDPDSPTGRRVNASKVAPTGMEQRARGLFDSLDGWGTYGAISIPFDAPIDLLQFEDSFRDVNGRADYDPRDDAVYVIDLTSGLPALLDTGEGNFQIALDDPNRYYPNDARGGQSNILFETVDETIDGKDTDFDGVIDRPNLIDRNGNGLGIDPVDQVDDLVTEYEMETNTLLVRPIVPLKERHEYAVVVTNRLMGDNNQVVRSPFDWTNHVEQTERLMPLEGIFADHADLYGGMTVDDVAFAWTFTTQSVTADLVAVNMGLRGEGPFASALQDFPIDLQVENVFGTRYASCDPASYPQNRYIVPSEKFLEIARRVGTEVLDVNPDDIEPLLESFEHIDYLTIASFKTPYLLEGEPVCVQTTCDPTVDVTCPSSGQRELCTPYDDVNSQWRLNTKTGQIGVGVDEVAIWIAVPKEQPEKGFVQPFPVAFYGHGYTSSALESLGFSGNLARQGIAGVGVTAAGHGLGLDGVLESVALAIFDSNCVEPLGRLALTDRARDLNNDGVKDSGADFWTGYVFHTRDMVRQSVVDYQQAIRIMQTFDGSRSSGIDYDGDGNIDAAGDLDGNGVPDFGGPDNDYYAWGQSLGGILSMIVGAVDPAVTATAPTAGSAGLIDVGLRSRQGGVKEAVILRVMGPLLLGAKVDDNPEAPGTPMVSIGDSPRQNTQCQVGQSSLWLVVPDLNSTGVVEFACSNELEPGDVVITTNLDNDEVRCARAGMDPSQQGDTRFRIGLPSDVDDHLEVAVYAAEDIPASFEFGDVCAISGVTPKERITTFEVDWPPADKPELGFQGRRFLVGESLIAPAEGLGLRRQSPDLRRFLMLAMLAVEPGDPASYAAHYFLDPLDFGSRGAPAHNLLDVPTTGDMNVPVNTGIAFARIAGILPFIPSSSPLAEVYPDYAATPEQEESYGGRTPNQYLLDRYVIEGLNRLERYAWYSDEHLGGADPRIIFDPDDLDESRDQWDAPDPDIDGFPPVRAHRPTPGTTAGVSAMAMPYVSNHGDHGFEMPTPNKAFDINTYMINLLGRYFRSRGEHLQYIDDPAGHTCLEDVSCDFLQ